MRGPRGGDLEDRRGQIGEEAPRAGERLLLGIDRVIDRAAARLDLPAAELEAVEMLRPVGGQRVDDRRPGDEQRRGFLGHHRVVARRQARRAEPGHRAEPERDDRHEAHIRRRVVIGQVRADPARQVGAPGGLDRLDRAAAARALDDADDRQPQIVRHLLGHQRLFADRRVGRAAAHREIVADDDDRAAVDPGAAHHAVRRHQLDQPAVLRRTRRCRRSRRPRGSCRDRPGRRCARGW